MGVVGLGRSMLRAFIGWSFVSSHLRLTQRLSPFHIHFVVNCTNRCPYASCSMCLDTVSYEESFIENSMESFLCCGSRFARDFRTAWHI
jgi:hypothetical protein